MPGLVVFRRRWSVGSDDLVVPGAFLLATHIICVVIVFVVLLLFHYDATVLSTSLLWYHQIGYFVILLLSICAEAGICVISMRGSILDAEVRTTINLWIYLKSLIMLLDITWLILGTVWLANYYIESSANEGKRIFLAIIICNWALAFITVITIWCTFDAAGRSWVKMKKYQRSMRATESRFNYKRSNSTNRNWRQRKVIRAYQDSWDHRCRLLFCCMGSSERNRNSFTDIARLLSDFFRELDVVPSDVIAGLVLLRKFQKVEREAVVRQKKNGTYEFLSGVPITERTQFLALNDAKNYEFFQKVIHFMYFAQGAYGWPMYLMMNRSRVWNLVPEMNCLGCCCAHGHDAEVIQDNCCYCNYAALKKTLQVGDTEIIYVTYHVDVGETPFFVAIDYSQKKIVVSIRGTLSMKDILTDLNAEGDVLPLDPPRDDWLGHKGMVQAAIYIKNKLQEENLIEKALQRNPSRNTQNFGLVLVGHSLGAGTAAILALLMKPDYPSLQCYSYSPPGGLLSMPAVEYSKSFITSVVLGKDVVPRIGLYQMEALRADLINAIQRSVDPKWKTISCSVICCGCGPEPTSVVEMSGKDVHIDEYQEQRGSARSNSAHPIDSSIALTLHQPLFPPGRIIHIVRHHPKPDEQKYDSGWRQVLKSREPVYQAIWAETTDFDEVLISPVMLQDHMPDKVLAALKKVVATSGPRKPQRQSSNAFSTTSNDLNPMYDDGGPVSLIPARSHSNLSHSIALSPIFQNKVYLETSFTNLQSPNKLHSDENSKRASPIVSAGYMGSVQSSAIDDSITSVIRRSPSSVCSDAATIVVNGAASEMVLKHKVDVFHHRPKAVAFDMSPSGGCGGGAASRTPSPKKAAASGSILQRQSSTRQVREKPNTLQFPPLRRASLADNERCRVDLLHDDWFGLAPLASPETLSEISSISSRTPSASISLANSIERYFQSSMVMKDNNSEQKPILDDIYESQLITPKVMRRAPKFRENLSTCAENSKNVDQYKRLGRVFITCPQLLPDPESNVDSSDDSFKSAQSISNTLQRNENVLSKEDGRHYNLQRTQCDQGKLPIKEGLDRDSGSPPGPMVDSNLIFGDKPCSELLVKICGTEILCPAPHDSSANLSLEQCSTVTVTSSEYKSAFLWNTSREVSHNPGPQSSILESHFPVTGRVQNTECQVKEEPKVTNDRRWQKRLSSEEVILSCNHDDDASIVQILDNYMGPSSFPACSSHGRKRKGCVYPVHNSNVKIVTQATKLRSDSPTLSRPNCSHMRSRSHESSV